MAHRSVLVVLLFASLPLAAHGEPVRQCSCRAYGADHALGATICIRASSGSYLARCEMVLNNTSWKKIGDSCPQASLRQPASKVMATPIGAAGSRG
ncbi:MAG: hypothetical protein WAT70_04510 [Rhizobiaceae bacterium]